MTTPLMPLSLPALPFVPFWGMRLFVGVRALDAEGRPDDERRCAEEVRHRPELGGVRVAALAALEVPVERSRFELGQLAVEPHRDPLSGVLARRRPPPPCHLESSDDPRDA